MAVNGNLTDESLEKMLKPGAAGDAATFATTQSPHSKTAVTPGERIGGHAHWPGAISSLN